LPALLERTQRRDLGLARHARLARFAPLLHLPRSTLAKTEHTQLEELFNARIVLLVMPVRMLLSRHRINVRLERTPLVRRQRALHVQPVTAAIFMAPPLQPVQVVITLKKATAYAQLVALDITVLTRQWLMRFHVRMEPTAWQEQLPAQTVRRDMPVLRRDPTLRLLAQRVHIVSDDKLHAQFAWQDMRALQPPATL